jgi:hypothetical protein
MEQTQRQKLDLELNTPVTLQLLFDQPLLGENRYGPYYLYAFSDDDGNEFSFFAPNAQTHMELTQFKAGDRVTLLKNAKQSGKKVVTDISVLPATVPIAAPPTNGNGHNVINVVQPANGNGKAAPTTQTPTVHDAFFQILESCYADAIRLQERFNGMVDVNRLAITLFIARSKTNGYNGVAS